MTTDTRREVARCSGFDVGSDDHGGIAMLGAFNYDGGGQGFGYRIDIEFVQKFLSVFRADRLRQVEGRYCMVTHTHCDILKVEPLLPSDGEAFDVHQWSAEAQARSRLIKGAK